MSLVSIYALHTCFQYMDCDPKRKLSETQHFECICAESPKVGLILFEKAYSISTSPHVFFLYLHPKHLTATIINHYNLSLSNLLQSSLRNLFALYSLLLSETSRNPNNGQETEPNPSHPSWTWLQKKKTHNLLHPRKVPLSISQDQP